MLVRCVVAAGMLALIGCSATSESDPVAASAPTVAATTVPGASTGSPATSPSATTAAPGLVTPQGYRSVEATVTGVDGEVCELCVWLADTPALRRRGLMDVTDLGAGDAMAFVYAAPHTGSFWMLNTPMSLSIAFFGADGGFLDAFDMEPCVGKPRCPSYPTAANFTVALEAPRGTLADLGVAAGSQLTLTTRPCTPAP